MLLIKKCEISNYSTDSKLILVKYSLNLNKIIFHSLEHCVHYYIVYIRVNTFWKYREYFLPIFIVSIKKVLPKLFKYHTLSLKSAQLETKRFPDIFIVEFKSPLEKFNPLFFYAI